MKETILRALFLWFALFILLQPIYSYIDYLMDLQIKANTSYLTQKAATEGMVTSTLRNEVTRNLERLGFSASDIEITSSTTTIQDRKTRIDVYIRAPRINMFPYSFGQITQPTQYYGHGSIMSEYLD